MKISSLKINNFRNYDNLDIDFCQNLNIFLGKNAQGKTNLLESIFFCGLGKSFKSVKDKDTIKWGKNFANIKIKIEKKHRNQEILIILNDLNKKSVKIEDISIKKTSALLGEMPVVFFSPNELKLVKESPDDRRKFLNISISQMNKRYFYALSRYEKILQNRNKLLKTSKNINDVKQTIDIWNKSLVENAEIIFKERVDFVGKINPLSKKAHLYLSNEKEILEIKYKTFIKNSEKFKKEFLEKLEACLEKDFKMGYTTTGVHRDDLELYLNNIEVKQFGSQGQQRTVALSLKLAEVEILKEQCGEYPILLLDDVFSELDGERRKKLLNFTKKCQTFLTTTDFDYNVENCEIFNINDGKIVKK